MAKKVVLLDDIDGTEPAFTVEFGLDDWHYEIELSDEHIAELWKIFEPYKNAARKVS